MTNRAEAIPPGAEIALRAPEQGHRGWRFAKELAYVAVGLPLVVGYSAVIATELLVLVSGAGWVGAPLLRMSSALVGQCAALERRLANGLLDARISPLPPLAGARGDALSRRVRRQVTAGSFWRAMALLVLRVPLAVLAAAVVATGVVATAALLVYGIRGIFQSGVGYVGPFSLDAGLGVVLCLLSVPVAVVTVATTDRVAAGLRALVRSLLVTSLPPGAPVRETLARSLGDRTLSIVYWLPEREEFVDERGHPVPLPAVGTDRAWTAVDYEGRRVAAILHDASLEASPELVQAAAAAASLALDNERLKAELRARVEELSASRVRIVEASNNARRRLERDLHDGAQQQLVAMAVELRLLRNRVGDNPEAAELIGRIQEKLSAALEELRDLAQGIHPGILTDRGLAPALESLAARVPLSVACEIDLHTRPPASVEAVAYFVINEALTNVLKYARAEHATLRARYQGSDLVVELRDDGIGGVDESRGTGIQGLRDRVGALGGTIEVESVPGAGTLVRAHIPTDGYG